MPINLQNTENISTGWPGPPQLHAPEIGSLVGAILRNRLGQQELTQKSVSDAIKQMQEQRDNEAFMKAAQQAGIIPQGDYGGLSAKSGVGLASAIAAQTKDTEMDAYHQALADYYNRSPGAGMGGRGGGTPRVMRQLPNGEWAPFTPGEAYKIDTQTRATKAVGELSAQEAEAQSRAAQYEKKYGVDTESGGLKAPGIFADQATKDQFARDQAEYFKAYQDVTRVKKQRENYEKWYKGTLQPGGDQPGGQTDEEDTPLPQGGASPAPAMPPPQAQSSPSPAATPRPNAPPPADSAAGHAPTYGTPASPGSGQSGDLIVGQSKRFVNGKAWTWWGDKGWLPD